MQIHQVLHGYKNGHQLLEASISLPSDARSLMLSLSDLSGSSTGQSVTPYLSSYPIPEIGSYALARTWYAPEMRRPGCVWTHTLLLQFGDLAKIDRAADLLGLFRRPNQDFEQYSLPLVIDVGNSPEYVVSTGVTDLGVNTLRSVYGDPSAICLVTSSFSQNLELFILELWSQQWARLRRNFCFCTLALAPRHLNGRSFDLQVVPSSLQSKFSREIPNANFVHSDTATLTNKQNDDWLEIAARDLGEADPHSNLRRFLRQYTADVSANRSSFVPLVQIFSELFLNREASILQLLENVALQFPSPKDAAALKADLFGPQRLLKPHVLFSDQQLLTAFATTNNYQAFDVEALMLGTTSTAWAQANLSSVNDLLSQILSGYISPIASEILNGLLKGIAPDDALELASQQPQLAPLFVANYPSLATSPRVWEIAQERQSEVLDSLYTKEAVPWKEVIAALLDAHVPAIAPDVIRHLKNIGAGYVLDWLASKEQSEKLRLHTLSADWNHVLVDLPDALLGWLYNSGNNHHEASAFIVTLLNPTMANVRQHMESLWLPLARNLRLVSDKELHNAAATFLLAVSFDNTSNLAPEIASIVFPIVHEAAATNKIPHASWRTIQNQLPSFDGNRNWDKCERLREALINNARHHSWPSHFLLAATHNIDTFRRVVAYCKDTSGGEEYLKTLRDEVKRHPAVATKQQAEILLKKNWLERLFS